MFKSLASLGNVEAMAVEGFLLLHSGDFLRAAFNKNPVLTGSVCMAEGVNMATVWLRMYTSGHRSRCRHGCMSKLNNKQSCFLFRP